MARKKLIDDDRLLELLNRYFVEVCHGFPQKFSIPKATLFIQANGYPEYAVETLRRNTNARKYIDTLKESSEDKNLTKLISYKTLDSKSFVERYKNKLSLISALTELDTYYKGIVDSALIMSRKTEKALMETEALANEVNKLKEELSQAIQHNNTLNIENRKLTQEVETCNKMLTTYLYPEIATKYIIKNNLLKNPDSPITDEGFQNNLVSLTSTINMAEQESVNEAVSSDNNDKSKILDIFSGIIDGLED